MLSGQARLFDGRMAWCSRSCRSGRKPSRGRRRMSVHRANAIPKKQAFRTTRSTIRAMICLVLSAGVLFGFAAVIFKDHAAHSWIAMPCVIDCSRVIVTYKKMASYNIDITYHYAVDQAYSSDRYDFNFGDASFFPS